MVGEREMKGSQEEEGEREGGRENNIQRNIKRALHCMQVHMYMYTCTRMLYIDIHTHTAVYMFVAY